MDPSMATRYHYHSHSHKQMSYVKVSIRDDIWIGHITKLNARKHRLTTKEGRPEGPLLGSTEGSVLGWYDGNAEGICEGKPDISVFCLTTGFILLGTRLGSLLKFVMERGQNVTCDIP